MSKYIIGINWEQNSSASLFYEGECLGALSNERVTRKKNDEAYPKEAIDYLLKEFAVKPKDIASVVFVSSQWAPGWILTRHYTSFTTADYLREQKEIWYPLIYKNEFYSPLDVFAEKLDLQQYPGEEFWKNIIKELNHSFAHASDSSFEKIGQNIRKAVVKLHLGVSEVEFMDHSSCHNAYAYFSQPNRKDTFLSISLDAFGDGVNYSAKIFKPQENKIEVTDIVKGGDFIIGRLYRYITLILGLKPNEHEYKVMGLAPYCKPRYYGHLLNMFKDFQDVNGLNFVFSNRPKDLFFEIREKLFSERFDSIAGATQAYTEYLLEKWVTNLVEETQVTRLCFAGGVAMNVKANMVISQIPTIKSLIVPPCPDDTSQCIGAVYQYLLEQGSSQLGLPIKSPYLGRRDTSQGHSTKPHFLDPNVEPWLTENHEIIEENHISAAAQALSKGKVLGVIWGREEFGARALGNRSIVANPTFPSIKKRINEMIKDRDFWMPFAASMLERVADSYLNLEQHPSAYAYMTNACNSTSLGRQKLQAALHPYDQTCRPHVVMKGSNPDYELLLEEFGNITGTYALLNTSLNLHGLPICSTLSDAFHVLQNSDLDGLITKNALILQRHPIVT